MNIRLYLWLAACGTVWLLAGCGNGEAPPTAVSQAATETLPTLTATLTATAVPTDTPIPSSTPTAVPTTTPTPEATATHTNSPTPEPTATDTPPPSPSPTVPVTAMAATPTTAVPVAAPVGPPAAPAPAGPNLLVNPGFEGGTLPYEAYRVNHLFLLNDPNKAQFIHSGNYSAFNMGGIFYQRVADNVSPGTTYRAGAWLKIWSSSGEDRTISENPGDFIGRLCLNTNGDGDPNLPTSVCTGWVRPLDVWQYISVDAVATNSRVAIIFQTGYSSSNRPKHNEAYWDDAALGTAPAAATATPLPQTAVRPAPVPFQAAALRDNMQYVRSQIEQMGGVLDRLYNGEPGKCTEYQGYYNNLIRSTTYDGVPAEWQGIYNDYIFAVENTIATNEGLNSLCSSGGGGVTQQNYGAGRQGINASLERLVPAIEAANALLGG